MFVLVGVLSHSGKFRAWLSDRGDQAHLVEGIDWVLRLLGGSARRWRVDRMATVLVLGTDRIQASFVGVAKHYGVGIDACPPRRPNRKGVVEKAIHYIAQPWGAWPRRRTASTTSARGSGMPAGGPGALLGNSPMRNHYFRFPRWRIRRREPWCVESLAAVWSRCGVTAIRCRLL